MKQTKTTDPLKNARAGVVNDRPLENIKRAAEKLGLVVHAKPTRTPRGKGGKG